MVQEVVICIVCLDWQKGKITSKEAYRNIGEIFSSTKNKETKAHLLDLSEIILEKELKSKDIDDKV